jgi:hypothetical protein
MPKYKVKVDHVNTYDVVVEAPDEDQAEDDAIEVVQGHLSEETTHLMTCEDERFDIESVALVPEPTAMYTDTDAIGALMPDGTQLSTWDERLRIVGGVPIFPNKDKG